MFWVFWTSGESSYILLSYMKTIKLLDATVYYRVDDAKQYSNDNVQVVLVGNKCDCEGRREITYEQGQELAETLRCPFFEASGKTNVNVDDAFEKLIDAIFSFENKRAAGESESTNNLRAITGVIALANTRMITSAHPTFNHQWCRWC